MSHSFVLGAVAVLTILGTYDHLFLTVVTLLCHTALESKSLMELHFFAPVGQSSFFFPAHSITFYFCFTSATGLGRLGHAIFAEVLQMTSLLMTVLTTLVKIPSSHLLGLTLPFQVSQLAVKL